MTPPAGRRAALVAALAATAALAAGDSCARGETAFVVAYHCDGGRRVAVGYPACRDAAEAPIRLGYDGRTVLLDPVRAGSGARYASRAADLQWWTKGPEATLSRRSDGRPLAANCREF